MKGKLVNEAEARKSAGQKFRLIDLFLIFEVATAIAIFLTIISPAELRAQQGYLNLSFWNRSRVYSQRDLFYFTNQYENIFHLELYQKTLNYGQLNGWFDGRISGAGLEVAHWYLSWQGFQYGKFELRLRLGDQSFQLTRLGYKFTNYYPAFNYLRGFNVGFHYKKLELDFFTGRVARLSGLFGSFYQLTDQTASGFLLRFSPEEAYTFGFGFVHSENETSWSGELLSRRNDLLLFESELKLNNQIRFVSDNQVSFSRSGDGVTRLTGASVRHGIQVDFRRSFFELSYRRIEPDFKSLSSEFAYDRDQEGVFLSWRSQPSRALFIFGAADYFHDNVQRRIELNTTDFLRLHSGFSLINPPWPDFTLRLDLIRAESRRPDDTYRNYLSPGFYLQLARNLGQFYPYFRVRFQRYDDRVQEQRDFTSPSFYAGLRYNYLRSSYLLLEVENGRFYDYLENKTSALNRVRLAHYSPFFLGSDFYGELTYSNQSFWYLTAQSMRMMELYLGLSRMLPYGIKMRFDFRASWPLDSNRPANYWFTVRLDRRFNWGEAPVYQGKTSGPALGGTGKIEGLVFADRNLNGIFDREDLVFPGVWLQLEDGSGVESDRSGRFAFSRVPEGLHTLSLDVRNIPAEFYLLSPEFQKVVVERRRSTRLDFMLVEGATVGGKVFLDVNKNGYLDEDDQPLKDILVILKPVPAEELPASLEKMRTEELSNFVDQKGNFVFENILPGRYELLIEEETLPRGVKAQVEFPIKLEIKPGQNLKDLKILFLPRPVIYSGRGRSGIE